MGRTDDKGYCAEGWPAMVVIVGGGGRGCEGADDKQRGETHGGGIAKKRSCDVTSHAKFSAVAVQPVLGSAFSIPPVVKLSSHSNSH